MAHIVKVQTRHFKNVILKEGDCVSVPPLYFGTVFSQSVPHEITKIYGRVLYVSEAVAEVKVKWDVDGLIDQVNTSKIEVEDRNTPTQTLPNPNYDVEENRTGSSNEAAKTHILYDHLNGEHESAFCEDQRIVESPNTNEEGQKGKKRLKKRKNENQQEESAISEADKDEDIDLTIVQQEGTDLTTVVHDDAETLLTEAIDGSFSVENHETVPDTHVRRKHRNISTNRLHKEKYVQTQDDPDEFVLLQDAIDVCDEYLDKEMELVITPPDNVDGDTDGEVGNDADLGEIHLDNVQEVSGRIEVQTSRKLSRTFSKKKKDQPKTLPKHYKVKVKKEIKTVEAVRNNNDDINEKINMLLSSAEVFNDLRNWEMTKEEHEGEGLEWKQEMKTENKDNFKQLNDECAGKLPVEIFEKLFNAEIR